ncbi:phosphopantothenoylcysteine decarboxylase [bacterium (Candidatus Blackallbacteria) CG17_big_fil_post_rev_8_21_14_2_50_48_46]|uniref:Phosphopantothenoylcysteine decarboxylase n=1 Tax=bacterium (Candidatus Blackallbacteria) CG17_big_fil_post_rev_8_21_14_2_50_48_46 TaxID=2014261 RepID=A0A2M7G5B2_9BACT|nr:MAG: phosphopantothenoylcysteine decarboxylase [bacterium (Candidatus Blackallbacteria) CG18_big_fil_WC_8_21_14_2_50_49_26]PIW17012.1 MAG: phosphopantothenoylcysteine decarboxylase [bacterium (Candidatus Blackallbacteria) CG17_big_fil_post_rev_8_21_14_2_50_48_46]PIW48180.1 MAG: phosphopantothenoylcysteine decarboxylase [bacterium (Candidatus Blackallbacteria) CG13_big_fil_rev_8_21_14_2_50_49_14]
MSARWNPLPPEPSDLDDHAVRLQGDALQGKRIALLVCGGIAAIKAPLLVRELRRQGAEITVFVSEEALRYTTEEALAWSSDRPVISRLSSRSEHLSGQMAFDACLVAPATYNTLNKFRNGIADTLLTTFLASALGRLERGQTRILVAPTLHGSMHNAILTESLNALQEMGVEVIPPKQGDGKHLLPELEEIVMRTARSLTASPLRGIPVLVTGGPTPVHLDQIRRLTNRFTGQLGIAIAKELWLAGAEAYLIQGESGLIPPVWLPHQIVPDYATYQQTVLKVLAEREMPVGIFSAAVADYSPREVYPGKRPSGETEWELKLVPTEKVIQRVQTSFPELMLISFKFEAQLSHAELMQIARQRLESGHAAVIANRAEEQGAEQVAWLVTPHQPELRMESKAGIARALKLWLEQALK